MNIRPIGDQQIIMCNPMSKHNYFGWPTVARLQDGRIAVAASGFRLGHVCPFGKTCISYSADEGKTYLPPIPVIDTALDDRDGGVLAFGENSLVVTSFNNRAAAQYRCIETSSKDGKQTSFAPFPDVAYRKGYLDAVTAEDEDAYYGSTMRISHDGGITFSPLLKSPVSAPHGPLRCADGKMIYVGTPFDTTDTLKPEDCYIEAWSLAENGAMEYIGHIDHIYSDDGELLSSCEPHAIELPDGRLLCHIRVQKMEGGPAMFTTYQSVSEDKGKTWSKPQLLLHPQGGAPAHLLLHSSGVLISVYGNRVIGTPSINVMLSRDLGESWQTDYVLVKNEFSGDVGYPSTIELNDGSLLTVYYGFEKEKGPAVIWQQRWELTP